MRGNILVVDDEENQREMIAGFLRKKGHEVTAASSGDRAVEVFRKKGYDVVVTDYRMRGTHGVGVLKAVKELNPTVGVILISAYGTVETAVEAMKEGAEDFLVKPIDLEQLEALLQRALSHQAVVRENRELKERLAERYRFDQIVGESGTMQEAMNLAARVAKSKATVLIRGESGTGKGLLANAIHLTSDRADGPFIETNCAALSPGVLESELFGHEKGAFTGADRMRAGRFEHADGGTIFIDEIGDLPLPVQVKLLNVIQEEAFQRVGGNETVNVDVRIIAATHQDLEVMLEEGRFRQDLYFRLNVVSIAIPPLRGRRSDIPLLVEHFVEKHAQRNSKKMDGVSREALDCIMRYPFPGNVRELENALERAVVLSRGTRVELEDLPPSIRHCVPLTAGPDVEVGKATLPEMVEDLERRAIVRALEETGGIRTKAAELLGISERNLRYKMEKYQVEGR
jgi:two-component system NtrC family response regulator